VRVFISWSGELSKELAEAFRNWLPSALQYVKPYFTPADIEKGSKWATEIFKELSASSICVIVLTRDNLASNWIMFEAGAISCTIDRARVCPIIFDLEETDLQGPLAQFQATKFTKLDIRKLFLTINSAASEQRISDSVADTVFEKWWPDLETQILKIVDSHKATRSKSDIRSERDLIEELLLLTRKLSVEFEEGKLSAPETAPVRFEITLYKKLMDLIDQLFELAAYDNEDLVTLKTSVERLLPTIPKRNLQPPTKDGLIVRLTALLSEIDKYLNAEE
jgi:hypothetical protein